MFTYLYNSLFGIKESELFDYNKYKKVLEYIPDNTKTLDKKQFNLDKLVTAIDEFCVSSIPQRFIVSLSGGVDSMVLIYIIRQLGYEVIGLHINYNNRPETIIEQQFLEEWCKSNNIRLHIRSIDDIKRAECKRTYYEIMTRKIRFEFYRQILADEGCSHILLAHHKDDIIENIFANVCRGRNILDLAVIRKSATIDNIDIMRPMLDFYKDAIYSFAHTNQIPYFKDTTPGWSVRGKYRNIISPAIEDAFTKNVKSNLLGLSEQSDEWNNFIGHKIIEPFMDKVMFDLNSQIVEFSVNGYCNYPMCFWRQIFMKIFYHYNLNCPSKRGVQTFINAIMEDNITTHKRNISLANTCQCIIKKSLVTITINDTDPIEEVD